MKLLKAFLIVIGFIAVGLGILGMFLPILPTTPFLLLAAACFAKSSNRFYHWLLNNKWFGSYIKNYREGKVIPLKIKIMALVFLWSTILLSTIFFLDNIYVRIVLLLIALAVTIHISLIKTKNIWDILNQPKSKNKLWIINIIVNSLTKHIQHKTKTSRSTLTPTLFDIMYRKPDYTICSSLATLAAMSSSESE